MNDVIFNGSKNKKPISFCEVSLVIHNDKGRLPIEYTDVEIKRRYYRSGESEYFINKNPCRLKDIHELFVDTGMSANAYSVIELKMIESILSNDGSNFKRMLDEAAGISNYIQKRKSSKNKKTRSKKNRRKVILVRVEEEYAAYSTKKRPAIPIIKEILKNFSNEEIVVMGRYSSQVKHLEQVFGKKIRVLSKVVDSKKLLENTDVFIGSGGTMTAESALLGIPTISYNAVPNICLLYTSPSPRD